MLCDFFQAEDGIRDVERSRGLGDVYKRQIFTILLLSTPRDGYDILLFKNALVVPNLVEAGPGVLKRSS